MDSYRTKSLFNILIIATLLIAAACGSRSPTATPIMTNAHLKQYTMHVQGVECKLCAQTVLDLVSGLPGMSNVRYYTTDDTYKKSHVTFVFDQESGPLPREQLKAGLIKEGFSLVSLKKPLTGNF